MNIKTKVVRIKITSKAIALISKHLSSTHLNLADYELVSEQNKITGYQFFEDDYSLQKVINVLGSMPVLSSVKTNQYEKHVYQMGGLQVDVSIFFSKENRGTFLVISPYEKL